MLLLQRPDLRCDRTVRAQIVEEYEEAPPCHLFELLHKIDAIIADEIRFNGVPNVENVYFFSCFTLR